VKSGRFLASDGVELYWRSWTPGAGSRVSGGGSRATVLLVHGVGEHGDRYAPLAGKLTAAGFTCYAFDHRGHGRSAGHRGHVDRWERYEADVVEFVDGVIAPSEGTARLVGYGHSMGALILLTLALTNPPADGSGFRGFVISGASIRPSGIAKPILVAIARALSGIAPRVSLDLGIPAEALSHDAQVVADYDRDPLVGHRATVRWGAEALAAIESIKRRAHEIDLPMLIVHGGADPLAEAAGSRWLAEVVGAESELLIYENALHEPHNEPDYADVAADVVRWIDERLEKIDPEPTRK